MKNFLLIVMFMMLLMIFIDLGSYRVLYEPFLALYNWLCSFVPPVTPMGA